MLATVTRSGLVVYVASDDIRPGQAAVIGGRIIAQINERTKPDYAPTLMDNPFFITVVYGEDDAEAAHKIIVQIVQSEISHV